MEEKYKPMFIYIFERLAHIFKTHPGLLEKNDVILKNYGIDFRNCLIGPGLDVLGCLNLDDKMEVIMEMGKLDEIQNNPAEALEIIRASFMKSNYNYKNLMGYSKDVA